MDSKEIVLSILPDTNYYHLYAPIRIRFTKRIKRRIKPISTAFNFLQNYIYK